MANIIYFIEERNREIPYRLSLENKDVSLSRLVEACANSVGLPFRTESNRELAALKSLTNYAHYGRIYCRATNVQLPKFDLDVGGIITCQLPDTSKRWSREDAAMALFTIKSTLERL